MNETSSTALALLPVAAEASGVRTIEGDYLRGIDEKKWRRLSTEFRRIEREMIAMYESHEYRLINPESARPKIDPKCPKVVLRRRIKSLFSDPFQVKGKEAPPCVNR